LLLEQEDLNPRPEKLVCPKYTESDRVHKRAKMTHKNRKSKKNHFLKSWMFSFEG
jgi:hypothetical protein